MFVLLSEIENIDIVLDKGFCVKINNALLVFFFCVSQHLIVSAACKLPVGKKDELGALMRAAFSNEQARQADRQKEDRIARSETGRLDQLTAEVIAQDRKNKTLEPGVAKALWLVREVDARKLRLDPIVKAFEADEREHCDIFLNLVLTQHNRNEVLMVAKSVGVYSAEGISVDEFVRASKITSEAEANRAVVMGRLKGYKEDGASYLADGYAVLTCLFPGVVRRAATLDEERRSQLRPGEKDLNYGRVLDTKKGTGKFW